LWFSGHKTCWNLIKCTKIHQGSKYEDPSFNH
jgi:hypothetical protein